MEKRTVWRNGPTHEQGIEGVLIAVIEQAHKDLLSQNKRRRIEAEQFLRDARNHWEEMFFG